MVRIVRVSVSRVSIKVGTKIAPVVYSGGFKGGRGGPWPPLAHPPKFS